MTTPRFSRETRASTQGRPGEQPGRGRLNDPRQARFRGRLAGSGVPASSISSSLACTWSCFLTPMIRTLGALPRSRPAHVIRAAVGGGLFSTKYVPMG
jgi:hypothetical protein